MINFSPEQVMKHSVLCGFVLSQPLATYVDAYPVLQNKQLLESESNAFGEHSETVHLLQQKLNDLSYYHDSIDGDYGILTEHAVKKLQRDHHVHETGQADVQTIYALIDAEKERYKKEIESLSEPVYPGMHSTDVKTVQKALNYFGYYEGEVDGIYGPLTERALKTAEEELDLELSDEITQQSLETMYDKADTKSRETWKDKQESVSDQKAETQEEQHQVKNADVKGQDNAEIAQIAKEYTGTPYVWGGDTPDGFDCSGFIQYVYETQDITIPRTVSEIWNFASPMDDPSVGDLVFFSTYKPGPSHMGIYVGNGEFIHAGESRGVEISELDDSYWKNKYLGAKRIK